jgi:hypothetical protein
MLAGPDFLIIGGQKCGTTSLYNYLIRHPGVLRAARKELRYFTQQFELGDSWYRQQFPNAKRRMLNRLTNGRTLTGEATPYYLFHPLAPARIRAAYPRVRLIAMLRNPVDRAFSHYKHHVKLGEEHLPFEDAIAAEQARLAGEFERLAADGGYVAHALRVYSYLARGVYADQYERWYRYFAPDRILTLSSEQFFSNPAGAFAQALEFLGLPEHRLQDYETFNPGREETFAPELRERLIDYFRPHNERLYRLLDRDFGW